MNNIIQTKNIRYQFADFIIQIKMPKSTTALVLSEIIHLAEHDIHIVSSETGHHIANALSITVANYRKSVRRLIKLNLLIKENSYLKLNIKFHSPITSITVKQ